MVHILVATSLSRVTEKFDYNSKRTLKRTITAIPGLSFNQNNKNDFKVIPTLLSKGRLSKISKRKNSSSNTTLSTIPSPDTLQTSTPDWRQSSYSEFSNTTSTAYQQLCCKRSGIPDVFQKLCETGILTLNVKQSILSKLKSKNLFIIKDIARVHTATKTDFTILSTVLAHAEELEKLIEK